MVRGPTSGNGTRSSVYYLDSAGLVPPRPRPPAQRLTLDSELDPLAADMQADGSLAARPGIGGSWRGAGGRWLLWPLRVVLWTALVGGRVPRHHRDHLQLLPGAGGRDRRGQRHRGVPCFPG